MKILLTLSFAFVLSVCAKAQIQGVLVEFTGQDPNLPVHWYTLHLTPSQNITSWEVVFSLEPGATIKDVYNSEVLTVVQNGTALSFKPKAGTWAEVINAGSQLTFGFSIQNGLLIDNVVQCFHPVPDYLAQNCLSDYEVPESPYNYDSLWVLNHETGQLFTSDKVTGFVGIGTTNPLERFQIGDEIVIHDGGTKLLGRNFHFNSANKCVRIKDGFSQMVAFDAIGNLDFRTAKTNDVAETEHDWNLMRFTPQGNLGIGIIAPVAKLEVGGNITIHGESLSIGNTDGKDVGDKPNQRALYHTEEDELIINYNNEFEGGTIVNSKVGIGTSNIPDGYLLAVGGDVIARKVKVAIEGTEEWNDKVFEAHYPLMSLEEIDAYVKENKHLPGIPSAEEVVENGVDLGEMQAVLLGKIEELTLYMIELKKENELLKKRLEQHGF